MSSTNVLETRIHRHGIRAAARAMEGLLHGYENPMDSPLGLVQPIEIQGLTAKIDRNSVWNFGLERSDPGILVYVADSMLPLLALASCVLIHCSLFDRAHLVGGKTAFGRFGHRTSSDFS